LQTEEELGFDARQSKANKQIGQDLAASTNSVQLMRAKAIARQLGARGPVTMDDVTRVMIEQGHENPARLRKDRPLNWKGSVFRGSEWVQVGHTYSTRVSNHSRAIKVWALKSWVNSANVDGEATDASAYSLIRIWVRATKAQGKDPAALAWYIGTDGVSDTIKAEIERNGYTYYGAPVSFINGSAGAILCPSNPARV